ncbi:MAG: hypothetical protein HRU18_16740 [Pseudoalteromonas sp.]|uniref:portal protein n=1 Tax=Pseudoalteromonas sp. TaxID=53249 RepID=UPI001D8B20D0|nr:portal protein [Pseudoalteromonas sp.]NRA79854.1 hypothetical protein [Pseudoalteromonas sp.]
MADIPKGLGSIAKLLKRFSAAEGRYNIWRSLHQEAMDYSTPQRETFTIQTEGQRKNHFIFDSTAEEGIEQFASRIQSSLMPSWQQWINLTAGTDIPEEEKEATDKALKQSTDVFFANLNHSNFDTEITPSLIDLGIGTGAILVEENDFNESSAFSFTNIPLAELYIEKPARGSVKSVWRKQKVEVGNIEVTWPDADIPAELQKMIDKDPNAEVDILNGFLFNSTTKLYDQVVIWQKHLLFTQSFETKRLIVFRWSLTPGEAYGRGPAIKKLPDIRTANKIVELTLGNAALQMSGVYTGRSDGIFNPNTVRIAPGAIIPVGSNETSNPSLRPLPLSGNLNIADNMLEGMRESIRKAFFASPLGEFSDPVRSATEQSIRNQEFLKQSGASIGRQKTELIEPLVAACVDILISRGKIPQLKVDGKEVTIKQNSPLANAEDLETFQNTNLWLSTLAQYIPPEVLALKVKIEELPAKFAAQLGVDPTLVRSDAEAQKVGQQVTEAAGQQLQGGANEPEPGV